MIVELENNDDIMYKGKSVRVWLEDITARLFDLENNPDIKHDMKCDGVDWKAMVATVTKNANDEIVRLRKDLNQSENTITVLRKDLANYGSQYSKLREDLDKSNGMVGYWENRFCKLAGVVKSLGDTLEDMDSK